MHSDRDDIKPFISLTDDSHYYMGTYLTILNESFAIILYCVGTAEVIKTGPDLVWSH